MSIVSAPLSGL